MKPYLNPYQIVSHYPYHSVQKNEFPSFHVCDENNYSFLPCWVVMNHTHCA